MRFRKKQNLSEAEINLTPLIDVCFVILIMFIVVAPLLDIENVELCSSPPNNSEKTVAVQEKSPVTIHVFSDNTISMNQRLVTLSQLKVLLASAKQSHPEATPQVFHDKNAKFGTYHEVKNAVETAGFSEMHLILKPE